MKKGCFGKLMQVMLIVALAAGSAWAAEKKAEQWKPLFDGQTLDGWEQKNGKAKYTIEDGVIVGTSVPNTPNSFLCTKEHYADFILEYEFNVHPNLNSGVQIRSNSYKDHNNFRVHGYQVEIDPSQSPGGKKKGNLDENGQPVPDKEPRAWTAGIYDEGRRGWLNDLTEAPKARKAFKPEQWNKIRVEAEGDSIKTFLNGVPASDLKDDMTLSGFIALQVHGVGGRTEPLWIKWRNLRIQDLGGPKDGSKNTPPSEYKKKGAEIKKAADAAKKTAAKKSAAGSATKGSDTKGSATKSSDAKCACGKPGGCASCQKAAKAGSATKGSAARSACPTPDCTSCPKNAAAGAAKGNTPKCGAAKCPDTPADCPLSAKSPGAPACCPSSTQSAAGTNCGTCDTSAQTDLKKADGSHAKHAHTTKDILGKPTDTMGAKPVKGAKSLFDAKGDLSAWRTDKKDAPLGWKVDKEKGEMQIVLKSGDAFTKQDVTDFRLHLEFKVPAGGTGQGAGNSGIYIQERYEVQILNSYGKDIDKDFTYQDCGSLYKTQKPLVNACKKPGEWQAYDIVFRAARWDGEKKTENARITIHLNGQLLHDDFEIPNKTGAGKKEEPQAGPIKLQNHNNEVTFRNIWLAPLEL